MSETEQQSVVERLPDLLTELGERVTALKRAIVDDEDEASIVETAEDLWEVLEETEELLDTIDFSEVPDAIDVEELPETVDVDDVPEGLLDEDEEAIELDNVREAINLRELWDAVDLTELREEEEELEDEVDDVTDDEEEDDDGLLDDEDEADDEWVEFENVIGVGEGANVQFDAEARQEAIEDMIENAVRTFRSVLLETHDKLRAFYEYNQQQLGQPGRQPDSLNPTAYSSLPDGPLPDSASTRASTVPSQVKYSRADNPRRIYGRRFENADRSDSNE